MGSSKTETTDAPVTVFEALAKVWLGLEMIEKSGFNPHFKYKYVQEADLVAAVRPLLIENGLLLLPIESQVSSVMPIGERQLLTTLEQTWRFYHVASGTSLDVQVVSQGADSQDKGAYKASTGGLKFALMRSLLLVTGDEPELDHGRQPEAKAGPTQRAPAAKPTGKAPARSKAPAAGYATKDELKAAGVYKEAFAVAERCHGKNEEMKFVPLNYAADKLGIRSMNHVRHDQIEGLIIGLAEYENQVEAANAGPDPTADEDLEGYES